jgi:hypothetical protein
MTAHAQPWCRAADDGRYGGHGIGDWGDVGHRDREGGRSEGVTGDGGDGGGQGEDAAGSGEADDEVATAAVAGFSLSYPSP